MAVANSDVARSDDVKEAALNLNLKAYESRRTLAAVWDLRVQGNEKPPQSSFSLDIKNDSDESIMRDTDERVLVNPVHFGIGGKYRSIVKLFISYEFQNPSGSPAMGTGWLIQPDVFVTAGHCGYDWSHKLGRATLVQVYIGYDGRSSAMSPNVQSRQVKRIVMTEGWLKTKGSKSNDVSFMQVDRPFTGINPIRYEETPPSGSMALGIVGYPGDLKDPITKEQGAHMYEVFLPTKFNLAEQADTMLEYEHSTFGGLSGSPVLRQSDLVSIGTHVYGGTHNSASVIGKYGNPYNDYLQAFSLRLPNEALHILPIVASRISSTKELSGLKRPAPDADGESRSLRSRRVQPPDMSTFHTFGSRVTPMGNSLRRQVPNHRDRSDQADKGFMDLLKTVGSALPVLGGPIGALAGFALNVTAKLAESTGAEGGFNDRFVHEGYMERAILAEATLNALQQGGLSPELEEGIFGDMKDSVLGALPVIRKVAPRIMGVIMEPALKIALDSLHTYNIKSSSGAEGFDDFSRAVFAAPAYSPAIDSPANARAEDFLHHVEVALKQNLQGSESNGEDAEKGFLDVLKAGIRSAGGGVSFAAEHGLSLLADHLQTLGGAESLDSSATPSLSTQNGTIDQLATRALVADAALEASLRLPPQQLQEEGFFYNIGHNIKKLAPIAIKAVPSIAQTIEEVGPNFTGQKPSLVSGLASNTRSLRSLGPSTSANPTGA